MNRKFPAVALVTLTLLACESATPPPESTMSVTTPVTPADINAGKLLAAQCAQCHPDDNSQLLGTTPFLAGQHADYLVLALKSYKNGQRSHTPLKAHTEPMSEQDIVNVSAWYASLTPPWKGAAPEMPPAARTHDPATVVAGQRASRHCGSCHGLDGNSIKAGTPSLAGLQPEYLGKALSAYFNGERNDPIMSLFKNSLTKDEIKAIAVFFASQTRSKTTVRSIGNATAGKAKAAACSRCHGVDGNSINPAIPSLAGQNGPYLEKASLAYLNGQRKDSMMQPAVKNLKPHDLRDLAAWFASQEPRRFGETVAASKSGFDPVGDGARLAQNCNGCHGENGNSRTPGIPSLSRLHSDYFVAAIKAYRDDARNNATMKNFVMSLSDDNIARLALYYATREPKASSKPGAKNIAAGEKLAATCAGCHGEKGNSKTATTPSLAGQDNAYLVAAMKNYAQGTRRHADMQNAVKSLKEAEIASIAAYFAVQTPAKPDVRIPEAPEVMAQKCNRCHGDQGLSTDTKVPRIAGQSEAYLADTLRAYKSGARTNSAMKAMADVLSELEIKAIAAHYARADTPAASR